MLHYSLKVYYLDFRNKSRLTYYLHITLLFLEFVLSKRMSVFKFQIIGYYFECNFFYGILILIMSMTAHALTLKILNEKNAQFYPCFGTSNLMKYVLFIFLICLISV